MHCPMSSELVGNGKLNNELGPAISTSFYYCYPLKETLELIAGAGFSKIELGLVENALDIDRKEIVGLLDDIPVGVTSIHLPFEYLYRSRWENLEKCIQNALYIGEHAGCGYLVSHPPLRPRSLPYADYLRECERYFDLLAEYNSMGISISSENLNSWTNSTVWCISNRLVSSIYPWVRACSTTKACCRRMASIRRRCWSSIFAARSVLPTLGRPFPKGQRKC